MFKNVASQKVFMQALDSATGRPKTGDSANLTAYVSKDFGTVTALTDTTATEISATNAPGWYWWDVAQAETNADTLLFSGKSATSGIDLVGAVVHTRPPNFSSMLITAGGVVSITARLKKNTALANFHFFMTDSTTHNGATGKTVTVTRVLAGGTFSTGTLGAVTEVANGLYRLDIPAADLNADVVSLYATASGCDALPITLLMEP